jgi:hypothetical protein
MPQSAQSPSPASTTGHASRYLGQVGEVAASLDPAAIERMADGLAALRARGGRLFLVGVGGSAANCSHAVNDFRKLCGIEAYAPTDNVSELTARTNDEGWETVFSEWLATSQAREGDALFVMSVGGGSLERGVSAQPQDDCVRNCRPRWRPHQAARPSRRRRADGRSRSCDAAHRSFSGRRLALPRVASAAATAGHKVVEGDCCSLKVSVAGKGNDTADTSHHDSAIWPRR